MTCLFLIMFFTAYHGYKPRLTLILTSDTCINTVMCLHRSQRRSAGRSPTRLSFDKLLLIALCLDIKYYVYNLTLLMPCSCNVTTGKAESICGLATAQKAMKLVLFKDGDQLNTLRQVLGGPRCQIRFYCRPNRNWR